MAQLIHSLRFVDIIYTLWIIYKYAKVENYLSGKFLYHLDTSY